MKKVALSLIALLAAGSFAFGEDKAQEKAVKNPLEASLSANGSAKVGFDLDTGLLGITNAAEAKLKLTIIGEGDSEKGSGTSGYIKIEKLKVETEASSTGAGGNADLNISVGNVTAKILIDAFYVQLFSAAAPSVDYEGGLNASDDIKVYSARYGATGANIGLSGGLVIDPQSSTSGGLEFGYTIPSVALVTFQLATVKNYDDLTTAKGGASEKAANNVEIKVGFEQKAVEKLTVKAGLVYATDNEAAKNKAIGFGGELGMEIPAGEGYTLMPLVQADVKSPADSAVNDLAYAALVGAKFRIPGKWDADSDFSGLFAGLQYGKSEVKDSKAVANASVTLFSEEGKLIPNVALRGGVKAEDLTAVVKTKLFAAVRADVKTSDNLKVYGETSYGADLGFFLKGGAEITGVIPMTTFNIDYNSNDFLDGVTLNTEKNKKLGAVTVSAKVSY